MNTTRRKNHHPANRLLGVLCLLTLLAVPANAGTLYLGLAADIDVSGVRYVSELEVSNPTDVAQEFSYTFVPTFQSANDFTEVDGTTVVQPGITQTFRGIAPFNETGMLKIESDDGLVISGRLVPRSGNADGFASQVPVFSGGVAGGQTYHLQGVGRNAIRVTSLGILNLSSSTNRCSVDIINTVGTNIIDTATLELQPFSQGFWSDVFDVVNRPSVPLGRFELTCEEPSYAFGMLLDRTRSAASLIDIAASGSGTPPVDPAPAPDPDVPLGECPNDGSLCWEERGLFHQPTNGNPTFLRNYAPPAGSYTKVQLRMTVLLNNWYGPDNAGLHNFFWLYTGQWRNGTLGYANTRGPNRNLVRNLVYAGSEGLNQLTVNQALVPGTTYIVGYELDTSINQAVFTLDDVNGTRIVSITHRVLLNKINIGGGGLLLWTGNQKNSHGPEVPSLGWDYRDAQIILTP